MADPLQLEPGHGVTAAGLLALRPRRFTLPAALRLALRLRPGDPEPSRVRCDPTLPYTRAEVTGVSWVSGKLVEVTTTLGPAGGLGRNAARWRRRSALQGDDPPPARAALDALTHRVAWARQRQLEHARPELSYERSAWSGPGGAASDPFVAELLAYGGSDSSAREGLPPEVVAAAAGRLLRGGVGDFEAACRDYFRATVALARPGGPDAGYRLVVGPLTLTQYLDFLPDGRGTALAPLLAWARLFVGPEREPEVLLVLRANEVPVCTVGREAAGARVSWLAWVRRRGCPAPRDARALIPAAVCRRVAKGGA